jgi:hypothetical protein
MLIVKRSVPESRVATHSVSVRAAPARGPDVARLAP